MSNLDMSVEMSVYNKARRWAKASHLTDGGRVDRAFGLVKKDGAINDAIEKYGATAGDCHCPDNTYSGQVCKHRVAIMMTTRIQEGIDDWLNTTAGVRSFE